MKDVIVEKHRIEQAMLKEVEKVFLNIGVSTYNIETIIKAQEKIQDLFKQIYRMLDN